MKVNIILLFLGMAGTLAAQSNTAGTSGSIGKCGVWDYPYTLYNNGSASENINNGVTVTVDQNRNIGSVNLSGTGSLDFSGTNGITMSGSGGEINCRWDINRSDSHTMTNNDGVNNPAYFQNWGTFFTAPYTGAYIWVRGSGWSASLSGSILNGGIKLIKNSDVLGASASLFSQNQSNTCPTPATPIIPPTWKNSYGSFAMGSGETLQYGSQTRYTTSSTCSETRLYATVGNAVILYDN